MKAGACPCPKPLSNYLTDRFEAISCRTLPGEKFYANLTLRNSNTCEKLALLL